MRITVITATLLAAMSGAALAQGANNGSGAIHGQNWTMGQDLSNNRNLAPTPGTMAADRARRAERQRALAQNFDGNGRPAGNASPVTPQGRGAR